MKGISLKTIDNSRHVMYHNKIIKSFHWSDDFAFTKAREYADELTKLQPVQFKELYPEFFL